MCLLLLLFFVYLLLLLYKRYINVSLYSVNYINIEKKMLQCMKQLNRWPKFLFLANRLGGAAQTVTSQSSQMKFLDYSNFNSILIHKLDRVIVYAVASRSKNHFVYFAKTSILENIMPIMQLSNMSVFEFFYF